MNDEDRNYTVMTGVIMLGASAVVGLAHFGLFRVLLDSIRASEDVLQIQWDGLAPFFLFILLSAVSGWGMSWLAERRGLSSVPPVLLSVVVALGLAVAFTLASIHSLPRFGLYLFLTSAFSMLAAMIARWRIES